VSAAEGSVWSRDADVALLFESHRHSILSYCRRRLDSDEDAEDAVQTTFVHALRSARRGVRPRAETAWLYAIARNVCRERWRSSRRSGAGRMRDVDELAEVLPAPEPDDDALFDLDAALGRLAARQREALLLREWRGLSYAEIARRLDVSEAAVETLLFRARRALADELEHGRHGARGLLGALLDLPRRLWKGGAAVKLAAGTTAVSVAIVAGGVVPRVVEHHRAPVRRVPDTHAAVTRAVVVRQVVVPVVKRPARVGRHETPQVSTAQVDGAPTAATTDPPTATSSSAPPPAPGPTAAAPVPSPPAEADPAPAATPVSVPATPAVASAPSTPPLPQSVPAPAPLAPVTDVVAPVVQTLTQPELPPTIDVGPVQVQTNLPPLPSLPALP
jgi:RNA polymerase sigma factor (sigma-70 family)